MILFLVFYIIIVAYIHYEEDNAFIIVMLGTTQVIFMSGHMLVFLLEIIVISKQ